jgi:hypothetical protein
MLYSHDISWDFGLRSIDRDATQKREVLEKLRCALHYTAQWIVSNAYRQTGFFADPPIKVY